MSPWEVLTIVGVMLPFVVGFGNYLVPRGNRYGALAVAGLAIAYGLWQVLGDAAFSLELLGSFGVTLAVDRLSGFFILMNGLVTAAVVLYCFFQGRSPFFFSQLVILHGAVNAVFICADFMSLYVALEAIGIAAFLLITYPRSDRSLWIGLRYLFVSNTAMIFYLLGAVLVYQANHSFAFGGLRQSPPEAIALIALGLLTKGGIFVSGLWLPLTHGESETPVSAMLSGVVVKAGVFPLLRCALLFPEFDPLVRLFGVLTALLGVAYAVFEKDTKRMLAFHTISQLGFVLAAPAVGGFYALTHGLVKSALFLSAGQLPSRNFLELKKQPLDRRLWIPLAIASASISGLPLLAGFGAKILTVNQLLPWQAIALNGAAVGTAISFAKFIFLPHASPSSPLKPGYLAAMVVLLGGLILGNGFYVDAYLKWGNFGKALGTVAVGWLLYGLIFQRLKIKLPRALETFEHLIGMMIVILTSLFWIALP